MASRTDWLIRLALMVLLAVAAWHHADVPSQALAGNALITVESTQASESAGPNTTSKVAAASCQKFAVATPNRKKCSGISSAAAFAARVRRDDDHVAAQQRSENRSSNHAIFAVASLFANAHTKGGQTRLERRGLLGDVFAMAPRLRL